MTKRFVELKKIDENKPLYHYTKSRGVQGILRDMTFYATKSNFLNDAKETLYTLFVVKQVLDELSDGEVKAILKKQIDEHIHIIDKQCFFITSFSVDPDSITLWAEFGDRTGYNLEFSGGELIRMIADSRKILYHGFLIYSFEKQKEIIRELIFSKIPFSMGKSFDDMVREAESRRDTGAINKLCRIFLKTMGIYSLFFKQEEFAAEQEYRIVFREKNPQKILFREKDGFLMPYITVNVKDKRRFIKKITVAPKNHVDLAKAGMEIFAAHCGYEVNVCLSKINLRY